MRKIYDGKLYCNLCNNSITLIYCVEFWGISPQTHLKPLLLLQKKIVRLNTFSTYCAHTGPIFIDLSILTIDKLVIHRISIMMYKFSNSLLPAVLNSLYQKNKEVHTYNTRAKNMFHISFWTQFFSSVSATIWNALMVQIDGDISLVNIKQSLKLYLLNNTLVISYSK